MSEWKTLQYPGDPPTKAWLGTAAEFAAEHLDGRREYYSPSLMPVICDPCNRAIQCEEPMMLAGGMCWCSRSRQQLLPYLKDTQPGEQTARTKGVAQ